MRFVVLLCMVHGGLATIKVIACWWLWERERTLQPIEHGDHWHEGRDARLFDGYQAIAFFGFWVMAWSAATIIEWAYGSTAVLITDHLFYIGLIWWVGVSLSILYFLARRIQEAYGRHPFQLHPFRTDTIPTPCPPRENKGVSYGWFSHRKSQRDSRPGT